MSKSALTVLQVLPSLSVRLGGPPRAVAQASARLQAHDITPIIVATDMAHAVWAKDGRPVRPDELPEEAQDLEVHLFPTHPPRRLAFSPRMLAALGKLMRRVDVVHIHSLWTFPQFAAFVHSRRRNTPWVVSPRGALDPYLRSRGRARKAITTALWQGSMLNRASILHLTTPEEERLTRDIAPQVPRRVVPNGIDMSHFRQLPSGAAFRKTFLDGHDGPLVLFLGRINYKKGLDVLIRSIALLSSRRPDIRLAVVGPDDEGLQPRLEALARELGAGDIVHFTGPLYGSQRLQTLAAADVWALSSHTENFGVAVLEALAAGVPTVVSPGVNIAPELQAEGAAVVPSLDPESFADAISEIIESPGVAAELSERGRVFAERYDLDHVAPRLAAMYREAAGSDE